MIREQSLENVKVDALPFSLYMIENFIQATQFERLRCCLAGLPYVNRASDLYEFDQTPLDLKFMSQQPLIQELCDALYSDFFIEFLQSVLSIPFRLSRKKIDISAQRYSNGDFLLCHDDQLDSRRIALMIYFTSGPWDSAMGGLLERLDTDFEGRPVHHGAAVSSPTSNMAAFFEVTGYSFHQVTLVKGADAFPRLSITCWFHDEYESVILKSIEVKLACNIDNIHWANNELQFDWTTLYGHSFRNQSEHGMLGKPIVFRYKPNTSIRKKRPRYVCLKSGSVDNHECEKEEWVFIAADSTFIFSQQAITVEIPIYTE